MRLPRAVHDNEVTPTEQRLYDALGALFEERATTRSPSRYSYPLSRVSYDVDEIAAVCDALSQTPETCPLG